MRHLSLSIQSSAVNNDTLRIGPDNHAPSPFEKFKMNNPSLFGPKPWTWAPPVQVTSGAVLPSTLEDTLASSHLVQQYTLL